MISFEPSARMHRQNDSSSGRSIETTSYWLADMKIERALRYKHILTNKHITHISLLYVLAHS